MELVVPRRSTRVELELMGLVCSLRTKEEKDFEMVSLFVRGNDWRLYFVPYSAAPSLAVDCSGE